MALTNKLTSIADAIREKTDTTESMTLAEMPQKILDISGGTDTSRDTVTADVLLSPYTAHDSNGNAISGTIRTYKDITYGLLNLNTATLSDGYYENVKYKVHSDEVAKIIAENIKKDVSILGVNGTYEGNVSYETGSITVSSTTGKGTITLSKTTRPHYFFVLPSSSFYLASASATASAFACAYDINGNIHKSILNLYNNYPRLSYDGSSSSGLSYSNGTYTISKGSTNVSPTYRWIAVWT